MNMLIFQIDLDEFIFNMITIGSDFDKFDYHSIQYYDKTIEYCHSLDLLYYGNMIGDKDYSESFNVSFII